MPEKNEKELDWAEQRRVWNANGQCAREACRGSLSKRRYYNTGSNLYYCVVCARLINGINDKPLCWQVRPPGRYVTPDGVAGELTGYDELACRYTFLPDGSKPPVLIGPGIPYPYLHFGLEEALELSPEHGMEPIDDMRTYGACPTCGADQCSYANQRWCQVIKPNGVAIPDSGIFVGTAGSAEKEAIALLVVRWHHLNSPEEWVGIRLGDFTDLLRVDEYAKSRFCDNPILLRCLLYGMTPFIEEGFVDGWVWGDKDSVGVVTEKFTSALAKSPWARGTEASND